MIKENKQAAYLYISTITGILLGLVSSVINTRYISPEMYGDVKYVQNIINMMATVLLFGYFSSGSRLLALSTTKQESNVIRGALIIILASVSLILAVGTLACTFFHGTKPDVAALFIASIPVCFSPLFLNYVNTTSQGDNHIGRLSLARLLPSLIYVPASIYIYSQFGANPKRMMWLQWGISSICLGSIILSEGFSFKNLKTIFIRLQKENHDYGFHLYVGTLIVVATNYLGGIFLGIFNEDNTEVGFYTLALTVTSPMAMLPAIIGTTYFKKFATQSKIPDKLMKMTLLITAVTCIFFIVLIRPLVILLYTERYAPIGVYASWMSIAFCLHGFGDMLNRFLGSHGQGKQLRNCSFVSGIMKIIGYSLFVYLWNTPGAIATTICCDILYCAFMVYYYIKFTSLKTSSHE